MTRCPLIGSFWILFMLIPAVALPQDPGQQDLDQAMELQIRAENPRDMEKVVALCESALEKGLSEENAQFAKQLMVSALWQRADTLSRAILGERTFGPRSQMLRRLSLKDLEKLLQTDPSFADGYLLQAKLEALPGGNAEKARKAVDKAIDLFKDDNKKRSEALVLRARMQQDAQARLDDLSAALEADPSNKLAWQLRAAHFLSTGDIEKATADFQKLVEQNPEDLGLRQALAEALTNVKKYDLALEQINKAIELAPDVSINYTLRSQIYEAQEKIDEALRDLDKAVELEPQNPLALMMRARLYFLQEDYATARADVERLLKMNPRMRQAILLRSMIAAAEGNLSEAIQDVETLLKDEPQNRELQLQLASLYVADQRPRKAIALLTRILQDDKTNWMALRARADALLSVGKHKEAIEDYNEALKLQPEDDGILNNLAWVLATSPVDELRDGKRAIELATKACELTDYGKPHILSTLAAAYAETGDFETAIKWSSKAVELGREKLKDQLEQLEKELESYKQGKPWRELQEVKEKPDPPRRVIET